MMPITPMGVETRAMSRPLGRVQRLSSRPLGSGWLATSSTPLAMASMRASLSASRSCMGAGMSFAFGRFQIARIGGQNFRLAGADGARRFLQGLGLGRVIGFAQRRAPPRAPPRRCAIISRTSGHQFLSCKVMRRAPDRRDGSSRPGHDSPEWPRFRPCVCPRSAPRRTHCRRPIRARFRGPAGP